jgi:hypothetical protein
MDKAPTKNNKPVQTFRMANVKCAVWAHTTKDGKTFHNVSFVRSYTDEKGNWHDGDSYNVNDLPLVSRLAEKAQDWIYEERARLAKAGKAVRDEGEALR